MKVKMDILYYAFTVVFDNGWIPIVQMRVVEMTSSLFASEFTSVLEFLNVHNKIKAQCCNCKCCQNCCCEEEGWWRLISQ